MKKYEIIVAGGGFAGVAAAISAGRLGKKVLLIEKFNCLGGAACYDLVNPFMPYWTNVDNKRKYLSCGIFSEIVENMKKLGGMDDKSTRFNEEILKIVLNRMVLGSNAELLFNTSVISVNNENGTIKSVEINGVSGTETLEADYFIDCTGDANLAFMGGFPYRLGRESDNLCQPMTLCFRLGNVDKAKFEEEVETINPLYKKLAAQGKFRNPREDVLLFRTTLDSVVHFNTTRVVKYNPTNIWDVTKVEIEAREQLLEMVDFLKSNFSCFKNSQIISSGIQTGARESRMIDGLYVLNQDDMVSCKKFEDGIAACNYDIDIHSPDGSGTSHYYFPAGCYYTIPYRCLVPKTSKNLLVAGRCVSATHEGQASLRIMPVCCNLGEAVGVAACVAIDEKKDVCEADTGKIREILLSNGAVID